MKKVFYIVLIVLLCLTGCTTIKSHSMLMHGMVVGDSNEPVSGLEIFVSKKMVCRTNVNGFFEIDVPMKKNFEFEVSKSGWESKCFCEPYIDATKLYVYQIHSVGWIYAEIEKSLMDGDIDSASNLIEDLENRYGENKNALFLKSVVAYKTGDYESADRYFKESEVAVNENPSMKKFYEKIGGALWNLEK